ncbi:MAG: thioredoxin family protein [Verrucomicrobiota bacterium]
MKTKSPHIVSRSEWLLARKKHLAREKELTRLRDQMLEERRELPWVKVDKTYVFEGPKGRVTLDELFRGRSQLIVYHFMFGPDWESGCGSCSFVSDHFDAARQHFEHHDVALAVVSRGPIAKLEAFRQRMGWKFPWVSSEKNDFNFDYHVSLTPEQMQKGGVEYNYEKLDPGMPMDELPGASVFVKGEDGTIYHTYSTYARGLDILIGAHNFLDLTPQGRNETEGMSWVRYHDRYDEADDGRSCAGLRGVLIAMGAEKGDGQ